MSKQCDDRLLLEILEQSQDNETHVATLEHVDQCERCQHRLIELAADGDSWSEATHALRDSDVFRNGDEPTRRLVPIETDGSVIISVDSELSSEIPVQCDRVSLDFLATPSHPEMLGRIGQFDVERLIGTGGMGIVFKAFDSDLHRPVAVKVLSPHLAHSGGARQRFAREAQSAAAVVHENVVPIHHVDTHDELPFLVMQYVAGESLQARVDRDGPLSTREILQIGIQIARGLDAAHEQGLVHRDVKPGNILLEPGVSRVLISDFGLARAADDASVTRSGIIAGTPHYMSPEQARGQSIDTRSDLFGLGGVLYFMSTGRPPFRADGAMAVLNRICSTEHRPVDDVNEAIPADLADLIDRLLEKPASNRPESAMWVGEELSRQLKQLRTGRPRYRRQTTLLRRAVLTAMAASTLLVLAVWATIGNWDIGRTNGNSAPGIPQGLTPESSEFSDAESFSTPPVNAFSPANLPPTATMPGSPGVGVDAAFSEQLNELERAIEQFESKHFGGPSISPMMLPDELPKQIEEAKSLIES